MLVNFYTGHDRFCIGLPAAIKEGLDFIFGAQVNINLIPYDFSKINNAMDAISHSVKFIRLLEENNGIKPGYLPVPEVISVSNKGLLNVLFMQTSMDQTLKILIW